MQKYTLNTDSGKIHIYEDLPYNPTYGVAKASDDEQITSCNDLPSDRHYKDLGFHNDMNDAREMAKAYHNNPKFCVKCFGVLGGMLNRLSRNA